MDTKFSIAIHILILISESSNPMNSDQMAGSAGTNASYIRKILALLKRAGIVDSRRGIGGYSLALPPEQLTLLQIYQAVTEETNVHLLDIHQNPNDQCVVGRHIQPVLTGVFAYMSVAGKISQDFMTIYAVIIAFYFGTQSQKTQDVLDSAGTPQEGEQK